MTVYNFAIIDTTPGAGDEHPLAPSAVWEGDGDDYLALMRQRYKTRPYDQFFVVIARLQNRIKSEFTGPYAGEARKIITSLRKAIKPAEAA